MSTTKTGQQDTAHIKTYVLKNKYFPLHHKKNKINKKNRQNILFPHHYLLNPGIWKKMVIFYLANERDGSVLQTFNFKIPVPVTFDIFPTRAVDRKEKRMCKKESSRLLRPLCFYPCSKLGLRKGVPCTCLAKKVKRAFAFSKFAMWKKPLFFMNLITL